MMNRFEGRVLHGTQSERTLEEQRGPTWVACGFGAG